MKCRTLFLSPGPSGVAHYRADLPARALKCGLEMHDNKGQVTGAYGTNTKEAQVVVMSMPFQPVQLRAVDMILKDGKALVVDVDDLLDAFVDLTTDQQAYADSYTSERVALHEEAVAKAHLITTSTQYIADHFQERLGSYCPEIRVIPNGIDTWRWRFDRLIPEGKTSIGFCGGTGHEEALRLHMPAIEEAMGKHEEAVFILAGHDIDVVPEHLRARTLRPAWLGLDQYPAILRSFDINIGPTLPSAFYYAKSTLRCLEAWAAESAFVGGSDTYGDIVSHGVNGLLCDNPADMRDNLSYLLERPQKRIEMAQAGRKELLGKHQMSHRAPLWRKAIERAWRIKQVEDQAGGRMVRDMLRSAAELPVVSSESLGLMPAATD